MPIKKIFLYGIIGLITGFFSMYSYLDSYPYLAKLAGDGTPYLMGAIGLVIGIALAFVKNKKAIYYFVIPLWTCIVLGVVTLIMLSAFSIEDVNINNLSPVVTLVGIAIGSAITYRFTS